MKEIKDVTITQVVYAIICCLIVMHNLSLVRASMTGMMHAAQAVRAKWLTKASCLDNFGYWTLAHLTISLAT